MCFSTKLVVDKNVITYKIYKKNREFHHIAHGHFDQVEELPDVKASLKLV